jgi:hypothetical protein
VKIASEKELSPAISESLTAILKDFTESFMAGLSKG